MTLEISEIWIATQGKSPYLDETLKSCTAYLPNATVRTINYGLTQVGNLRRYLEEHPDLSEAMLIMLLDDDDLLIRTPDSKPTIGCLFIGCNSIGIPYDDGYDLMHGTTDMYLQNHECLKSQDFSGTIVTLSQLKQCCLAIDTSTYLADVELLRYLIDKLSVPVPDNNEDKPWVFGRCKKEPSSWKLHTMKQLKQRIASESMMAVFTGCPDDKAARQKLQKVYDSLNSNLYIPPLKSA